MRPRLTSLKFRLPWPGQGVVSSETAAVEYLDGDIHLPVRGPQNTTEARLVIDSAGHSGTRVYACAAYEEEMCYFHRIVRPSVHGAPVADRPPRRTGRVLRLHRRDPAPQTLQRGVGTGPHRHAADLPGAGEGHRAGKKRQVTSCCVGGTGSPS